MPTETVLDGRTRTEFLEDAALSLGSTSNYDLGATCISPDDQVGGPRDIVGACVPFDEIPDLLGRRFAEAHYYVESSSAEASNDPACVYLRRDWSGAEFLATNASPSTRVTTAGAVHDLLWVCLHANRWDRGQCHYTAVASATRVLELSGTEQCNELHDRDRDNLFREVRGLLPTVLQGDVR